MIDDPSTLVLILCVDGSLAELDIQGGAVGFHALPPLEESRLVELTRGAETTDRDAAPCGGSSSARWASTSSGSATRPAWCWAGSCASS